MDGLYFHKTEENKKFWEKGISLLANDGDVEIMLQPLLTGAAAWLVPAGNINTVEFFFIHSGEIEITLEGGNVLLSAGDSFYIKGLKQEVLIKTKTNCILLYISNSKVFKTSTDLHDELTKLLLQINEKDNYTFQHSRNVLKYSLKLYEWLRPFCNDETDSNLAIAALFHDVGKIYTPDEILKKKATLELQEYKKMMKHPIDSARLLKDNFNERVVQIAQSHHERLDGSGYPYGLTEEEISFEARILAVADVFDAMTTDRGYNEVKNFKEAAEELIRLSDKFDKKVTQALASLVNEEAFGPETITNEEKQETPKE